MPVDIETIKNEHGYRFPVIPPPYTCDTKGKCDGDDFSECNYHEPCPRCTIRKWCENGMKEMLNRSDATSDAWWEAYSKRLSGCMASEKIIIGKNGYFNWYPSNLEYCKKCSLGYEDGNKCSRHCEPYAGRND